MEIITREKWGAKYAPGPHTRKVGDLETWLHHTVTVAPDLKAPHDDDYAAVRAVERITEQRFGWGMAYTYLVTPAGLIFEGHGIDRVGAHTQGHNTAGAGIALVGNYSTTTPPAKMRAAVSWLLAEGVRRGHWTRPALNGGHRDTKATECPGSKAYALIDQINDAARELLDATPAPRPAKEGWDMDTLDLTNATRKPVRGRHVGNLQGLLMAAGYGPRGLVGSSGRPDGIAGPGTRKALGAFQVKTGTGTGGKADYVAGARTWAALIEG